MSQKFKYTAQVPFTGAVFVEFFSDSPDLTEDEVFECALDVISEGDPLKDPIETPGGGYAEVDGIDYTRQVSKGNFSYAYLDEMSFSVEPYGDTDPCE